jgi:hypothetical protein
MNPKGAYRLPGDEGQRRLMLELSQAVADGNIGSRDMPERGCLTVRQLLKLIEKLPPETKVMVQGDWGANHVISWDAQPHRDGSFAVVLFPEG